MNPTGSRYLRGQVLYQIMETEFGTVPRTGAQWPIRVRVQRLGYVPRTHRWVKWTRSLERQIIAYANSQGVQRG